MSVLAQTARRRQRLADTIARLARLAPCEAEAVT